MPKYNIDLPKTMQHISVITIAVALILAGWFFIPRGSAPVPGEIVQVEDQYAHNGDCAVTRSFDGVCLDDGEHQEQPLVAVMIENHIEANPLSGLNKAAVVYEAPVEGNIPRFMALFPLDTDVKKIGPIRSARPYYLDWLAEYPGTMYMHVGGSPDALERIAAEDVFDMNEFSRGWYFWRDQGRFAPHNAYTSAELFRSAHEKYAPKEISELQPRWSVQASEPCTEECITHLEIIFSQGIYAPDWYYVSSTNKYERDQFSRPHIDASGPRYEADTIVVQKVQTQVLDNKGRLGMETIGTGDAYIFAAGNIQEGTWSKTAKDTPTVFTAKDGQPMHIQGGTIWIEVVPQNGDVIFE
ncbi:MAG: DUF3048 domain-containing protein [Candidatus Magasanikbacteria bacterium]|jgi:hypothetical protein|nr:DUF3048 domain-containing protein [Candidatus Magasanikbacteria bacterium]